MANLYKNFDAMEYDGLVADVAPEVIVAGGKIRALSSGTATLVRGTVLAKSSGTAGDGKLVILGTSAGANETLTASCILCDDVELGTSDVTVPVYVAGCFNPSKVTVKNSYTMTEGDKDALRGVNILFKAVQA